METNSFSNEELSGTHRQRPRLSNWLVFFLFTVGLYGLITLILSIVLFDKNILAINVFLGITELVFGFIMLLFSAYTIFTFINRQSNAIFVAKAWLAILFLSNCVPYIVGSSEETVLSNYGRIFFSFTWFIVWFVYLTLSSQVNRAFPKEERRFYKMDIVILIIVIVVPVVLCTAGVVTFKRDILEIYNGMR